MTPEELDHELGHLASDEKWGWIAEPIEAEIARLRAAWLRVIQAENECRATGLPCREPALCGCKLEQEALCAVEDAVSDHPL
jgi:hypothetical protein